MSSNQQAPAPQKTAPQTTAPQSRKDELPDMFQILRQDQDTDALMRFYLQEDQFLCEPITITEDGRIAVEVGLQEDCIARMPFNKVIMDCVSDCCLQNPFIHKNSRTNANLIVNGRDMILGHLSKKHETWLHFLERRELQMIKAAYDNLDPREQLVLEYTVLSISNLMLKLSINMSKLSCILMAKKNTTNFLSTPTLSILFLLFMEFVMFSKKELTDKVERVKFLQQLPRITYLKFSEFLNKEDLLMMEVGQHEYFTKQSPANKHLQYLQFFAKTGDAGSYQKLCKYPYIEWVDLGQQLGIETPYGFEILFLFRTIYMKVIRDFKPDVVIFVQDFDSRTKIMCPKVRGLLINELTEEVTGKVYFMREVGVKMPEEQINQKVLEYFTNTTDTNFKSKTTQEKSEMEIEATYTMAVEMSETEAEEAVSEQILQKVSSLPTISQKHQEFLDRDQNRITAQMYKSHQKYKKHPKISIYSQINKIQEILYEDLSYVSLALIMRSTFEDVKTQSHQYNYSAQFLDRLQRHISNYCEHIEEKSSKPKSSELLITLRMQAKKIQSMLQFMAPEVSMIESHSKNESSSIIDLRNSERRKIQLHDIEGRIRFSSKDYVEVKYESEGKIRVFILSELHFSIVEVSGGEKVQVLINREPYSFGGLYREKASVFINDTYIWVGFGVVNEHDREQDRYGIYRADYKEHLQKHYSGTSKPTQKASMHWEFFQQTKLQKCLVEFKVRLENKILGWTVYNSSTKQLIFAGGYTNNCTIENKLNKFLHVINNQNDSGEINSYGKTQNDIFVGAMNHKLKAPLFPFIYGIPIEFDNKCYILNTNGYEECFTNFKKLFLTEFKLARSVNEKNGIISQRRQFVDYSNQDDRIVALVAKDHLISFLVNGYYHKNVYENRIALYTQEGGDLEVEMIEEKCEGFKMLGLRITSQEIKEEFEGSGCVEIFFKNLEN